MKKNPNYIKLCNSSSEKGAKKIEKRAALVTSAITILIAIIVLTIASSS